MRAVITAGGLIDGTFAAAAGTTVKALVPLGAITPIDAVLDACDGAGVEDVAVVGGVEVRAHVGRRGVRVLDAVADGRANLLRALDAWPGERFVFLTSDLPFANASGVRDFIDRSTPFALTMALADVDAYAACFPGAPEHSVAIGGERVANGNAFVVAPEAVAPARALATRFFEARKSLLRMALLIGPATIVRFAARRLRIPELEMEARRRLGVPVAAIRGCDPGLCFDVDTLAEYDYARTRAATRTPRR